MPKDSGSQHILSERAKHLSIPIFEKLESIDNTNYVRFKLGQNEQYGIPYHYINEVILNKAPTKVPYTADSVVGVINRHGVLISVLDLKKLFQVKKLVDDKNSQLVVVSAMDITAAILVDTIEGSDTYDSMTLSPSLQFKGSIQPDYVVGLHHGTIVIINIEKLLSDLQVNRINIKESMK